MNSQDQFYERRAIAREYNEAAEAKEEYEKVKWGSQEKMMNRFRWVIEHLFVKTDFCWLDIGCGTGAFQALVSRERHFSKAEAIDLSEKLLQYAKGRPDVDGIDFQCVDFLDYQTATVFDWITCIGVLQKTNAPLSVFFRKASALLRRGGKLFVDTKHLDWEMFKNGSLRPEMDHQWFRISELETHALRAGLKLEKAVGFLPGENQTVKPYQSHTIFLIFVKGGVE